MSDAVSERPPKHYCSSNRGLSPADQNYFIGSASRESENKESDYDILVIMPEGTHRRNTSKLLYKKVAESGITVDIIVATSEDIEKHKNNIGLIYRAILAEGRELYAA